MRKSGLARPIALTGTVALLISGLASSAARPINKRPPVTVTVWTLQLAKFAPYIHRVINTFEKAHPGVRVQWVDVPGTQIVDKYLATYAAKQAPDLINIGGTELYSMYKDFQPLNNVLTRAQINEFPQSTLAPLIINHKIYSIPYYGAGTSIPIIYNMALLRKAGITTLPTTQYQFNQDGAKLHRAEPTVYWSTSGVEPLSFAVGGPIATPTLLENGIPILTRNLKKAAFDTPKAVALVSQYRKWYQEGVFDPDSITPVHETALFVQGAIATYNEGMTSALQSSWGPIKAHLKVGPPVLGLTGKYMVQPPFSFSVSKTSKHAKLAAELAMAFVTVPAQLAFHKATSGGVGPITKAAIHDQAFYHFPPGEALQARSAVLQNKYLWRGVAMSPTLHGSIPTYPNETQINVILQKYWNDAVLGQMPAKQAMRIAAQKVNALSGSKQ